MRREDVSLPRLSAGWKPAARPCRHTADVGPFACHPPAERHTTWSGPSGGVVCTWCDLVNPPLAAA